MPYRRSGDGFNGDLASLTRNNILATRKEPALSSISYNMHTYVLGCLLFQSLVNWNPQNSAALLNVITELIEEYRIYQRHLIIGESRLQFEYSSLIDSRMYRDEDIEIFVTTKGKVEFYSPPMVYAWWSFIKELFLCFQKLLCIVLLSLCH